MIILLGGSGYVGSAFRALFDASGTPYMLASRAKSKCYATDHLVAMIQRSGADFLINAAGYTGKPNVDSCESHKAECLEGNAVLPDRVRRACEHTGIPWGHVSSGCIYSGSGSEGRGFSERDEPNFSFRSPNCSFYSGSKALGEEMLKGATQNYIWRLRIPFNNHDGPRNYLTKLLTYPRLLNVENSLSHLDDFVAACVTCWQQKLPFGTYNLTNPGFTTTREITELIRQHLAPGHTFEFFETEAQFMCEAAIAPRSNCILDTTKAQSLGIRMRPLEEAIVDSLLKWQPHHNLAIR